ncbi:MAG: tRNA 2-selenouridine(34) synthase MnmH [Paracoccaceae bacterium]
MSIAFQTLAELAAHGFDTVIDVRSPAEYAEDHFPGAINLPVLDDAERARVGTIYTQDSPFTARKLGAALVARNAARHLEGALAEKPGGWRPLVYCWRGGQRSGSFATILSQVGWRAEVIEGGYRSYRRLVTTAMHDTPLRHRLVLLDGNTGTAKTDLLALLAGQGVQTVDLEGLAAHRGSVFGAVATPQPSQKAFESALALALEALDPVRPVLVEAESSKIGRCLIPPTVWAAMLAAPRIRVAASLTARAAYLARAYADLAADREALKATLALLVPLQGHAKVEHWQALADQDALEQLAGELMEQHYDPRYGKSRGRSDPAILAEIEADSLTPEVLPELANRIASHLAKL